MLNKNGKIITEEVNGKLFQHFLHDISCVGNGMVTPETKVILNNSKIWVDEDLNPQSDEVILAESVSVSIQDLLVSLGVDWDTFAQVWADYTKPE